MTIHRVQGTVQRAAGLFADPGRRSSPPFPDPETTLALAHILRAERPEIVHAHNWLVHSWLPLRPAGGHALVVTLHDYSLVCAKKNLVRNGAPCEGPRLDRCLPCAADHYGRAKGTLTVLATGAGRPLLRRGADMILPVSDAVREGVRLRENDPRVRVVPNFVDEPPSPNAEEEALLERLPSRPFWLYAGAFSRQKGVETLLAAHLELAPDTPLVMVGYPASDMPASLADPPPGVIVQQAWPRSAVLAAMRRSIGVVVPSIWGEPCPTVVLEAMLAGRPVIASRIGGIPELVDDSCAILVEPGDPRALAGSMRRLAENAALADALGQAGAVRVERFRAGAVVPRIEAIYRELLDRGTES